MFRFSAELPAAGIPFADAPQPGCGLYGACNERAYESTPTVVKSLKLTFVLSCVVVLQPCRASTVN